jgi:hypothetical protein
LSVAGSAERKGVNTHGSNKESSEETGKEDRKEEIVSLPKHTPFLGWRRNSPAFFLRSSQRYETLFRGKKASTNYNVLKYRLF